MKKYVNKELDFELSHPAMLDDVQAHPDKVVFGNKKDPEETNFTVFVEQTEYVSLQDWLAAQPEGSADVDGYQLLLWLNGGATALVAETEITKRNAKGEAIDGGKRLWAVALRNRRLYKVSSPGFFPLNSVPNVNQGRMRIFTSFLTPALP